MKQKRTFLKMKNYSLKIGDFLDKKGFYLVIFLCIIVIGATIAVVSIRDYQRLKINFETEDNSTDKVASNYSKNAVVNKSAQPEAQTVTGKVSEQSKPAENLIKLDSNKNVSTENKQISKENKMSNQAKRNDEKNIEERKDTEKRKTESNIDKRNQPLNLDWPVFGKIINGFAKDSLIFSKTLQQWTTHDGIDINSKEGTPVRTAAEGVVKSIKNDPIYGITIIIEHNDRTKTIYSNLSTAKMVKVGQAVKRGKVISGVGRTAGFECEEEAHLHFEVNKDGKTINPIEYLSKI
ncbi:MAG: peptidoglycan DD-metalloendopeptidase family protein [Ignavibacteriales bacterium]